MSAATQLMGSSKTYSSNMQVNDVDIHHAGFNVAQQCASSNEGGSGCAVCMLPQDASWASTCSARSADGLCFAVLRKPSQQQTNRSAEAQQHGFTAGVGVQHGPAEDMCKDVSGEDATVEQQQQLQQALQTAQHDVTAAHPAALQQQQQQQPLLPDQQVVHELLLCQQLLQHLAEHNQQLQVYLAAALEDKSQLQVRCHDP
jgi:hypothetical protein